jgi:hypothetical protein
MIAVPSPSDPAGAEVAWALMAAAAVYFAPTLLAVARHRGAAPLTFSFNLLLGWTGVGWVLAWFLALADRRLRINVVSPAPAPAVVWQVQPPGVSLAPDGRHWWDGCAWRDGWEVVPRGALWSPDGACWFTGVHWVPACAAHAEPGGPPRSSGTEGQFPDEPEWWRRGGSGTS